MFPVAGQSAHLACTLVGVARSVDSPRGKCDVRVDRYQEQVDAVAHERLKHLIQVASVLLAPALDLAPTGATARTPGLVELGVEGQYELYAGLKLLDDGSEKRNVRLTFADKRGHPGLRHCRAGPRTQIADRALDRPLDRTSSMTPTRSARPAPSAGRSRSIPTNRFRRVSSPRARARRPPARI
jgi:hypothetical protein